MKGIIRLKIESSELRESSSESKGSISQGGDKCGESSVSMEGAGLRSVCLDRFKLVEAVLMVDGLLDFLSRLGEVGGSQLSGVLCCDPASSSEIASLTSSAGTGCSDANPSTSLFRSFANASFLRFYHTDFIWSPDCLMCGLIRRDGCKPFLFASSADMMIISGRSHSLSTFFVASQ